MEGNFRYVDGVVAGPRRDESRRCDTSANGQRPVAAVLSCADSRVPVELIFDQGIGDLFVLRVAGNIADVYSIGSIEYGVEHLGIPLIVVMGHSKCGAVKAAVEEVKVDGPLGELLTDIAPAAAEVKSRAAGMPSSAMISAAVRANVRLATKNLTSRSKVIDAAVKEGRVKIVGAVYDIHSGAVQWLDGSGPMVPMSSEASTSSAPPKAMPTLSLSLSGKASPSAHASSHAKSDETASSTHDEGHSDKDKGHGEEHASDTHGGHDASATTQPTASTAKRDNWIVLGSMLVGSMGMSVGVIQWIGRKKAH